MMREELTNDGEEAARVAQHGHQARIWTCLPGIIESVDLDAGELSVQPAIQGKLIERNPASGELTEKLVDLPLLIHVPIVWPTGGGFALTFPLKKGDNVLVEFASRAIDSWFQSGGVGAPVENRMHDLSDGFAHVGVRTLANKLPNVSAEGVQLRNDDGTSFIEISDSGDVNIETPGNVAVKAGGNVSVKATAEIVLEAPIIRLKGLIDMNGVAWATHIHGSTPPPSGPPVPG